MKYQSTALGEVIQGDDPAHPDVDTREQILERAVTSWGWTANIQRHEPRGKFVKFTAESQTLGTSHTLEVFIFPNLADSARDRPHEKRIQITRDYEEHQADFELDKAGTHRCLLLGFYCLDQHEVVICAWDAAAYQGHAKPTSCYVHIDAIAGAFRLGFARSQDAKGRYVCCFRPEFMLYYIENMAHLHVVETHDTEAMPLPMDEGTADASTAAITGGENIIFYGAPGTGKTHTVDAMVDGKLCVRTVFHPDMQNSDFVGALKPVMQEDRVTYSFSPGPFTLALRSALAQPERETYLVIEELNRAPAAAVFGDLFLLLDRDSNGAGKYDLDFPTPEFRAWLSTSVGREIGHVTLPSNLWLLATMNSADQGVYPIDTAFRRRWRQEYVPINYSSAPTGSLDVVHADGSVASVPWHAFAKAMNDHLTTELDVAEDRLLGPWFVTAEDLARSSCIPGKVLIYLWDDLLRHHGREKVFHVALVKTFGEVSERVAASERIFSDGLLTKLSGGEPANGA